jgi:hypothetical protein
VDIVVEYVPIGGRRVNSGVDSGFSRRFQEMQPNPVRAAHTLAHVNRCR